MHGRGVDRVRRAGDDRQRDDAPDGHRVEGRERREGERARGEHEQARDHDGPPAHPVGDGAAHEAQDEGRRVADEAHRAEPGGLAGEGVDQPPQGDRLDPEPEARDQRPGPEQAEVTRAPKNAEHGGRWFSTRMWRWSNRRPATRLLPRARGRWARSAGMRVWPGKPYPLGATWDGEGVNFAIFSENATAVELCLFDRAEDGREAARIRLTERDAFVWHAYLPDVRPGPALRLPRPRAVGAGRRASLQSGEAPDRPVRAGDQRARCPPSAAACDPRRTPPADPEAQRPPHAEVHRDGAGLQLGRRPPAAHAVEPHGDLRVPREGA